MRARRGTPQLPHAVCQARSRAAGRVRLCRQLALHLLQARLHAAHKLEDAVQRGCLPAQHLQHAHLVCHVIKVVRQVVLPQIAGHYGERAPAHAHADGLRALRRALQDEPVRASGEHVGGGRGGPGERAHGGGAGDVLGGGGPRQRIGQLKQVHVGHAPKAVPLQQLGLRAGQGVQVEEARERARVSLPAPGLQPHTHHLQQRARHRQRLHLLEEALLVTHRAVADHHQLHVPPREGAQHALKMREDGSDHGAATRPDVAHVAAQQVGRGGLHGLRFRVEGDELHAGAVQAGRQLAKAR
mmetsp:Transcript_36180/g.90791  ORF Transcript_36180/g.90791 Transcript_36180/m.90791 type:complete len:299 (-) Transcript_36180:470-1366(-)